MAYESCPVPLPVGSLEPPRRIPPTAVGTMTPPPRRPHRSRYPAGSSLLRRVALRGLAFIFLLSSALVLWPLSWQSSVGASLMSLSVHVAHRSLMPQRGSRAAELSESSRHANDASRPRSA